MRRPNILDVVQAVAALAPDHPEVTVWWYAPAPELEPVGDRSSWSALEIVVESAGTRSPDLVSLAAQLSERLRGHDVAVRAHGGRGEGRLFRMLTNR